MRDARNPAWKRLVSFFAMCAKIRMYLRNLSIVDGDPIICLNQYSTIPVLLPRASSHSGLFAVGVAGAGAEMCLFTAVDKDPGLFMRVCRCLWDSICAHSLTIGRVEIMVHKTDLDIVDCTVSILHVQGSEKVQNSTLLSWWINRNKHFDIWDAHRASKNFTMVLGQGGPVYKTGMPAGEVVAVKRIASNSKQGEKEFQTELLRTMKQYCVLVSVLGRLRHQNLLNLLGYCINKGQSMLIYEFTSNGSLPNLLYNDVSEVSLLWCLPDSDERLLLFEADNYYQSHLTRQFKDITSYSM